MEIDVTQLRFPMTAMFAELQMSLPSGLSGTVRHSSNALATTTRGLPQYDCAVSNYTRKTMQHNRPSSESEIAHSEKFISPAALYRPKDAINFR